MQLSGLSCAFQLPDQSLENTSRQSTEPSSLARRRSAGVNKDIPRRDNCVFKVLQPVLVVTVPMHPCSPHLYGSAIRTNVASCPSVPGRTVHSGASCWRRRGARDSTDTCCKPYIFIEAIVRKKATVRRGIETLRQRRVASSYQHLSILCLGFPAP